MATAEQKLAKQREFLAPYIAQADSVLDLGVHALRYFRCPEADDCEKRLLGYKGVLEAIPKGKQELKDAVSGIESEGFYMIYLFVEDLLLGCPNGLDEAFYVEPSRAEQRYRDKVAKAVDHRLNKKAPGFDGDGGGAARGGR